MCKSIELRGSQRLDITVCLDVLNRCNVFGGSGGVVFKVGLDGCKAPEVLGIHLQV